jgi:hypothetical protein
VVLCMVKVPDMKTTLGYACKILWVNAGLGGTRNEAYKGMGSRYIDRWGGFQTCNSGVCAVL